MSRRWVERILIALAVIAGATFMYWQMTSAGEAIGLHHHTYHVAVMRTEAELEHGLSDTKSLPADHAMLFVFPQSSIQGTSIWMKDMNYPLDIVWLNNDRVVIHMEKNVLPSTYNRADPTKSTIFKPDQPARYVIELPSGTIDETGIVLGDPAGLPSGV